MRLSILFPALLSASVSCLPTQQENIEDNQLNQVIVGRACTGENMSGNCAHLFETQPNKCFKSIDGDFPLDRSTHSLNITSATTCAFFQLDACIRPPGGPPTMLITGPALMPVLNKTMQYGISAYICGDEAMRLFIEHGNAPMPAGTVIIDDPEAVNMIEGPDVDVKVKARTEMNSESDVANIALTFYKPWSYLSPVSAIAVPGKHFCQHVSNLYGGWEGRIRSLSVEDGWKCTFHTEVGCAANQFSWTMGREKGEGKDELKDRGRCEGIRSFKCDTWK